MQNSIQQKLKSISNKPGIVCACARVDKETFYETSVDSAGVVLRPNIFKVVDAVFDLEEASNEVEPGQRVCVYAGAQRYCASRSENGVRLLLVTNEGSFIHKSFGRIFRRALTALDKQAKLQPDFSSAPMNQ